jgi:hypothetical protein
MHQKQPPAKTAILVSAAAGFCPWLLATVHAAINAQLNRKISVRFMFSMLDSCSIGAL